MQSHDLKQQGDRLHGTRAGMMATVNGDDGCQKHTCLDVGGLSFPTVDKDDQHGNRPPGRRR